MCLAVTGKIIRIENGFAEIDYGGISKLASLRLFESAKVGDYALVHAGFVIQILNQDDGSELHKLIEETISFAGEDDVNEEDIWKNGESEDTDKSANETAEIKKV